MRLASKGGVGFREAQAFRWFRMRKRVRQFFKYRPGCPKTILFIVGCQRSGTSMLHHLFRLDPDTVTYDEVSPLSACDQVQHLRWTDPELVKYRITADRAPLVVAKPLVESQNLTFWLDQFPDAKAIWMVRDFRDVAASNVRFFGPENPLGDLKPILADDRSDWRAQNMDPVARERIFTLHHGGATPHTAAALFWYARNSLFFAHRLDADPRIDICFYEDLVANPAPVMRRAYSFLGMRYPGDRIVRDVTVGSVGLGQNLEISPAVRDLCESMWQSLRALKGI